MPSRAFIDSDLESPRLERAIVGVLMPSRAFIDSDPHTYRPPAKFFASRLNALTGIY